jgi:DNA primase
MRKTTNRKKLEFKELDRSKFPHPPSYYSRYFKLPKLHGQVMVNCCFHDDRTPSLSIDLDEGWFNCFGCGAKGGDVLAFHMTKHTMNFIEACRDLNLEKNYDY